MENHKIMCLRISDGRAVETFEYDLDLFPSFKLALDHLNRLVSYGLCFSVYYYQGRLEEGDKL
jgi:hypothetical protein